MKNFTKIIAIAAVLTIAACSPNQETKTEPTGTDVKISGQSGVQDDVSSKNIVGIAAGSADHTTLVAAIKAAEYLDVLSNAGPFTVFAPVNAGFDKLPAGTVETLLKPENKDALRNILEYHVAVAVYKSEAFKDGQSLGMVNGDNIRISVKDGKVFINDNSEIVASVPATNGIIHVVTEVLLPPKK